ncbi:hypothetical protein SAMN05660489_06013 [Pseudomonas sp. LAMO17WK12:I10]|uniref:hypothetical protein n=1 Tax=unclassified Pseudomonas TaxID=196821 RepID=UPI000BDD6B6C|nr:MULTISPECIES: hypothetical protein [unclassified Pseudomonas]PXX52819.1 hypothetical protein H160_06012 [Pseudomonas sp. LAMO17WK12:I9]SNY52565.1 hypothetical protein SAMN05660489_06013 [Pseudomonas sp. LAMO17WK12:I10]
MNRHLLRLVAVGLSCLIFSACAQNPVDNTTQARFLAQDLLLEERNGNCRVLVPQQPGIDLSLKWPCQFHRDPSGTLRTKQVGTRQVILVESSEQLPPPSRDCRTEIQALRSGSGQTLEASAAVSRVTACPPFQWDEKMFIGLFEPDV